MHDIDIDLMASTLAQRAQSRIEFDWEKNRLTYQRPIVRLHHDEINLRVYGVVGGSSWRWPDVRVRCSIF